mgnify:CR=1 FL=1
MQIKILLGMLVIIILLLSSFLVVAIVTNNDDSEDLGNKETISLLSYAKTTEIEEDNEDKNEDISITGTALDKASAIALEFIGEGRVTDSEIDDEEGYYEIEITLENGQEVDVHLNKEFNILSKEIESYNDEED